MHSNTTHNNKAWLKAAVLLLAAVQLSLFAAPAGATTLLRMTLAQLAGAADTIVRGRCLSTTSRWEKGAIWTFAQVEVLETLKGASPKRIEVRSPGGQVGHLITKIEAAPALHPGDETILFLEKKPAGDYGVTAWAEGTFHVHRTAAGAATVTEDSSSMAVFDAVTRQFKSEGIRDLPLSEFRQSLAAALAQEHSR